MVCEWIGNSELIAAKHYLQVTEEHFEQATKHMSAHESRAQSRTHAPASRAQRTAPKKKTPEKPGFSRKQSHAVAALYPQGEANILGNPSEIHEVGTSAAQKTAQHQARTGPVLPASGQIDRRMAKLAYGNSQKSF